MKILVLTWEFPPRLIGGISRHCAELYPEITKLGHEIHLVTIEVGLAPAYEVIDGIHIYRVEVEPSPRDHLLTWIGNMNTSLQEKAQALVASQEFDLIHAHDWLVAKAAIAIKNATGLPLVVTIHATEYGRHQGIHNHDSEEIHQQERALVQEAIQTIVCSKYMHWEVDEVLGCPPDNIHIIYNGIKPEKKQRPQDFDFWSLRRSFATDHEKIIYYVGRMTPEKGIFVLLDAASNVLWEMGGLVKIVFVGGGNTDQLKSRAWDLGIWDKCFFTGFMSDSDLDKFQTVADCAVFPSLYEPFGIVALESFASHVPVVVSDAGGLPEVVRHGQTGIVTWKNNPDSLAWGILEVLRNPSYAKWLTDNAYEDLRLRFNWADIAQQTTKVYRLALAKTHVK
jgi:glycosyltransferase involved in cell wall biosynthesis